MPVVLSSSQINRIFRFGDFEYSVRAGELRKNGDVIRLQQQPLRVLLALLEYQGEVITRNELRERVWLDDAVQDVDNSMRVAINKLRQALEDDPDNPRYIETLPRRGYRWLYPVTVHDSPPVGIEPEEELEETVAQDHRLSRVLPYLDKDSKENRHGIWLRSLIVTLALLLAMFLASRLLLGKPDAPEPNVLPLTTYPGLESTPSISRDGTKVAFAWTGPNPTDPWGVYFKRIGDERPIRLAQTPAGAADGDPVWARDGKSIYFYRRGEPSGIYVKSIEGGEESLVVETGLHARRLRRSRFDLSPDGNSIVYPDAVPGQETTGLYLLDVKSLRIRQISAPPAQAEGDSDPAFSHDGKNVAFQRESLEGHQTFVMPTTGGTPRLLTSSATPDFIEGLAWTADDREVLVGGRVLRRVRVAGGEQAETVMFIPGPATFPALSNDKLAYVQEAAAANIWRLRLRDATHVSGEPTKLISSTRQQGAASFSADGTRIAFQSDRSGAWEIWTCGRDGSYPVQITHFGGPDTGTPRWSPDGRQIAFDSRATGDSQIYVVPASGGEPRKLTSGAGGSIVPTWSRDGKWIYYSTVEKSDANIMKLPVAGGVPQQVTRDGGIYPVESVDRKYLYFSRSLHDPTIWRVPMEGGAEERLKGAPQPFEPAHWAIVERGLYTVNGNGDLEFYRFDSGSVSLVMHDGRLLTDWSMAVSPDGHEIVWAQIDDRASDLMLVENFR